MTKTTNTLAELVPRFDKSRTDGRALKNETPAEAEHGVEKTTFARLVKPIDGKAEAAGTLTPGADERQGRPDQVAKNGRALVARPEGLQPQMEAVNAAPRQSQSALQVALKRPTESVRDAQVDAEDVNAMTETDGDLATKPAQKDNVVAHVVGKANQPVPVDRFEDAQAANAEGADLRLESDVKVDATGADRGALPVADIIRAGEGPVTDQRVGRTGDGVLLNAQPLDALRAHSSDATQGEAVANKRDPNVALQAAPSIMARAGIAQPVLGQDVALDAKMQNQATRVDQSGDADGAGRSTNDPRRVEPANVGRSDEVRPVPADRSASVSQSAAWAEPSAMRRLADVAHALRRVPGQGVSSSDRMGGSAEQNSTVVERVTLQAAAERPEQRARLAFETVTVQRSLGGREQMPAVEDGVEIKAPEPSIRSVQGESAVTATSTPATNIGTGAGNVYGQVVQSIVSTDGLPKSGAEFKLLTTQNGAGATPAPLKVLQLQLQPKELGEVAVRIALRGDKLELRVLTARQATADLLMSDQRLLVEALQQKNFDVDSVTIQVVDPDRNAGNQSGLPNGSQGKAGQGDSFQAATQGQTSGQNGGSDQPDGTTEPDRPDAPHDGNMANGIGTGRGIYL